MEATALRRRRVGGKGYSEDLVFVSIWTEVESVKQKWFYNPSRQCMNSRHSGESDILFNRALSTGLASIWLIQPASQPVGCVGSAGVKAPRWPHVSPSWPKLTFVHTSSDVFVVWSRMETALRVCQTLPSEPSFQQMTREFFPPLS